MRKRGIIFCGGVLAIGVILPLGLCAGPPGYYSEKYAGVDGLGEPTSLPGPIAPEEQHELHTCGMHAIRSIYRAYDVDPDVAQLRFRLGTDKPLTNFTPDLTGTIHPDILRVLEQDGFDVSVVLANDRAPERIRVHLGEGHPVLGLVKVGEVLHWIVLAGLDEGDVVVVDSLADEPYLRQFDDYARDEILNAILIRPAG